MSDYNIDNDFSQLKDVNFDLNWLIINYFCQLIDNDKD